MSIKNNKALIIIVCISAFFGLSAGFVGELLGRAYLFDDIFNIPFYGEISVNSRDYRPNLTIRDAKKVIVEQDVKVVDTINSVGNVIVGIFDRRDLPEEDIFKDRDESGKKATSSLINIHEAAGQGLIITSDGWVITSFVPEGYKDGVGKTELNKILDNYFIVTGSKDIYLIDRLENDPITPHIFIHAAAKNFSARGFAPYSELKNGASVLLADWRGRGSITQIVGYSDPEYQAIKSSDIYHPGLVLADSYDGMFNGAFLFNLNGDVAAILDNQARVYPISLYASAINSLLKSDQLLRPSLGVNYVNLSDLINYSEDPAKQFKIKEGALIVNNNISGADFEKLPKGVNAGLEAGDIIVAVNNMEITSTNQLNLVIQQYLAGEEITLSYIRNNEQSQITIEL